MMKEGCDIINELINTHCHACIQMDQSSSSQFLEEGGWCELWPVPCFNGYLLIITTPTNQLEDLW
ncbi:hypothetical protein Hanom_Chr12g01125131 [Helianthus anomalus]